MPDRSLHFRTRAIGCMLSAEEFAELCAIRAALHLGVRDILLIGLRRARRIHADELRRQRQLEERD